MGQMANSKVLLSDLKCGRCFLHRRRQVAAIVGGQECEAKSETEEDEELRLIRSLARWSVTEQAMEDNDKRRRVTQHSAVSNAALGGEKRRKRWRVTEKVVEEQQSNGGEQ
ncbi:BnaCnng18250D [Brassica napus]|uniref:BnaCnng18250D protein n=1 Tax=Brassica napus TaxID=3708 RepID=A0A078DA14_BRANA|nr:BnaCnng18250D [Brassica napus]